MPVLCSEKIVSAFLQIFQLMLGQKFEITFVATFIDFKNFTSWTSVFHYLDASLPLLKSRHKKLRACVLVNSFSMVVPQKVFNNEWPSQSVLIGFVRFELMTCTALSHEHHFRACFALNYFCRDLWTLIPMLLLRALRSVV